jgi:outer membrane protein TolC
VGQGRYQLGKLAENDLLQFELRYLEAKAKVDRANLNYQVMLNRLRIYLGLKDDKSLRLLPPAQTWHGAVSAANALEEAKRNTSTFLDFNERLLTAESQVRRAKMDERFDANLYLQFGLTQSNPEVSEVYKNPLDQQSVNLGLQVPILDWGNAKGKIKMAESNYELVELYVEQQFLDAEQTVLLNVMEFNMQKDQLYIAAKADTIAQKRYEVTQKRYMIGQINDAQELSYAQIDNDNAKQNYYSALQNYWTNYFELRKLTLYDFINNRMLIFDIRDVL